MNFAFLTHTGAPIGAPNPLQFDPTVGGNPVRPNVLFMRPGDRLSVAMHDTPTFYPFFSITRSSHFGGGCRWFIGNVVPGQTANDFGGVNQYGHLLFLPFLAFGGGGATVTVTNDFQNNLGTARA